jgi:hypothetical protein
MDMGDNGDETTAGRDCDSAQDGGSGGTDDHDHVDADVTTNDNKNQDQDEHEHKHENDIISGFTASIILGADVEGNNKDDHSVPMNGATATSIAVETNVAPQASSASASISIRNDDNVHDEVEATTTSTRLLPTAITLPTNLTIKLVNRDSNGEFIRY